MRVNNQELGARIADVEANAAEYLGASHPPGLVIDDKIRHDLVDCRAEGQVQASLLFDIAEAAAVRQGTSYKLLPEVIRRMRVALLACVGQGTLPAQIIDQALAALSATDSRPYYVLVDRRMLTRVLDVLASEYASGGETPAFVEYKQLREAVK